MCFLLNRDAHIDNGSPLAASDEFDEVQERYLPNVLFVLHPVYYLLLSPKIDGQGVHIAECRNDGKHTNPESGLLQLTEKPADEHRLDVASADGQYKNVHSLFYNARLAITNNRYPSGPVPKNDRISPASSQVC